MSGRIGYVVDTHPEDNSVDLLMASDGARLIGVQVKTLDGSTRTGSVDLPAVPKKANKWDITKLTGQDLKALVDYYDGTPVVTGFLFPQINQVLSNDPKLKINRHQSDVITTVDGDGNTQMAWASGLYIRVAEDPNKVDMTGQNADENAVFDRNTGRQYHVRISLAGKQVEFTMSPNGNALMELKGDLDVAADGHVNVVCNDSTVTASDSVTIDTPQTTITGHLSVLGGMDLEGGSGSTMEITGAMNISGGSISHNGKNIGSTHTHSGVATGGGNTGTPNP